MGQPLQRGRFSMTFFYNCGKGNHDYDGDDDD